jgi:hypothetical protein
VGLSIGPLKSGGVGNMSGNAISAMPDSGSGISDKISLCDDELEPTANVE